MNPAAGSERLLLESYQQIQRLACLRPAGGHVSHLDHVRRPTTPSVAGIDEARDPEHRSDIVTRLQRAGYRVELVR